MSSTLGDLECFPHPEFSVDERVLSRLVSECHDLIEPEPKRKPLAAAWNWYLSWAIPGMGMFSEAYILFAIGNIEPLLSIVYPYCWGEDQPADCDQDVVKNVSTIEICGIVRHKLDRRADPCPDSATAPPSQRAPPAQRPRSLTRATCFVRSPGGGNACH